MCENFVYIHTYIFVVLCDMNLKILQRRVKTGSNNNNSIHTYVRMCMYTKKMFMGKFIWHKCPYVCLHVSFSEKCLVNIVAGKCTTTITFVCTRTHTHTHTKKCIYPFCCSGYTWICRHFFFPLSTRVY